MAAARYTHRRARLAYAAAVCVAYASVALTAEGVSGWRKSHQAAQEFVANGVRTANGRDFSDDTTEFISALFAPVVILTPENFKVTLTTAYTDDDASDMSGPVMVSFFDPKCPHCRKFMPHYAVAARYFYDHNPQRISTKGIAVFAVDCDASGFLCNKVRRPRARRRPGGASVVPISRGEGCRARARGGRLHIRAGVLL